MKNFKKTIAIGVTALTLGATSIAAFAASQYATPAEAVAGMTGRSVESVVAEKSENGTTYGSMASDAGVLEEFKAQMLEMKKENLSAQVAAGDMTQEKADEIIAALEENMADCDGTGGAQIGKALGARFGSNGSGFGNCGENCGAGTGEGQGRGQGGGRGMGVGGMRLQDGSCYTNA
ncbi:MAG: DUF2680 domain-containing protein, partial [Oscillospiraceae bacterium]|nr:DUF2680 domain-containing protein [Oscillospiraceae bacterium]